MKFRSRSILAKLISLLALPLISLVVLWAMAASLTLSDGISLLRITNSSTDLGLPAQELINKLQIERQGSVLSVASHGENRATLVPERVETDKALATFRGKVADTSNDTLHTAGEAVLAFAASLPDRRNQIDTGTAVRLYVADYYSGVISRLLTLINTIQPALGVAQEADAGGSLEFANGLEIKSQELALVSGALASGGFQAGEFSRVVGLINTQRYLLDDGASKLPAKAQDSYTDLSSNPTAAAVVSLENKIVAQARESGTLPVDEVDWNTNTSKNFTELQNFLTSSGKQLAKDARPEALWIIGRLLIAGLLGLAAVAISIWLSIRIGRSLVRELVGLRRSALNLATEELPSVVRRLRAGEDVDVTAEVQPLTGFSIREVEGVAEAMDTARSTAVEVAIEEAQLRQGVREVFLNLARRSQALVHRQLTLLDAMERREKDPDELDDLFKLDHLATRMRRHAEDLIVLSGSTPGRGWRNPVPLIDVMRGAVAEVEDYARVRVVGVTRASLAGRSVSDVIHLLAELIENATAFSPPHTTVHVSGELVPAGFAIEIEDRGLGMPPEQIAAVNERLAVPPEFDLLHSERLGLFVVGQLAQRHGIQVVLRASPFGGTTAIVLLPTAMVITPDVKPDERRAAAPAAAPAAEPEPATPRTLAIAPALQESFTSEPVVIDPPPPNESAPDPYPAYSPGSYASRSAELRAPESVPEPEPEPLPEPEVLAERDAFAEREPLAEREAFPEREPLGEPIEAELVEPTSPASSIRPKHRAEEGEILPSPETPEEAAAALKALALPPGWPEPVPAWPARAPLDSAPTSPAEPPAAPAEPESAGAAAPPLARRQRGVSWDQLTSGGIPSPNGNNANNSADVDLRPRGVARAPLASRATPEEAESFPAPAPAPADPGSAGPAPAEPGGADPGPATGGLPRRVRQASLAAPLRSTPPAAAMPLDPASMRPPEEVRNLMSSYQRGSLLGRTNAARTIGQTAPELSPGDDQAPAVTPPDHGEKPETSEEFRNDEVAAGRGALDGSREGER